MRCRSPLLLGGEYPSFERPLVHAAGGPPPKVDVPVAAAPSGRCFAGNFFCPRPGRPFTAGGAPVYFRVLLTPFGGSRVTKSPGARDPVSLPPPLPPGFVGTWLLPCAFLRAGAVFFGWAFLFFPGFFFLGFFVHPWRFAPRRSRFPYVPRPISLVVGDSAFFSSFF